MEQGACPQDTQAAAVSERNSCAITHGARRRRLAVACTQNVRDHRSRFFPLKRLESLLKLCGPRGGSAVAQPGPQKLMKAPLHIALALVTVTLPAIGARRNADAVQSSFLYAIDDGAGRRSTGWAALTWEPKNSELFLVANGVVDIFNDNGLATIGC